MIENLVVYSAPNENSLVWLSSRVKIVRSCIRRVVWFGLVSPGTSPSMEITVSLFLQLFFPFFFLSYFFCPHDSLFLDKILFLRDLNTKRINIFLDQSHCDYNSTKGLKTRRSQILRRNNNNNNNQGRSATPQPRPTTVMQEITPSETRDGNNICHKIC